jgi:hypothetical protein
MAQTAERPAAQGSREGGRGGFNRDEWRQRMTQRLKEDLAVSDDEWKVLEPRIEKVRNAQMQARGGFGRGGPGGREGGASDQPQSALAKASQDLRTALDDKSSTTEVVKARLEALRQARTKAREDLAAAQKELRELLSVKQEAYLVMTGMLE